MKSKLFTHALLLTSAAAFAQPSAEETVVWKVLETETRVFHEANA